MTPSASVTLLRHATVVVSLAGARVLVDPMLDPVRDHPRFRALIQRVSHRP